MVAAAFPTGIKWQAVLGAAGEQKYIVCNGVSWVTCDVFCKPLAAAEVTITGRHSSGIVR
ncbi:MAG: hypothetical protein KDI24_01840 [Pseudomonadales bacterium]|nr:hypothetical protein [Pseudomonadales bacterium]MCP5171331.1 hypothetical protein [Pseudomonadales bacterium]